MKKHEGTTVVSVRIPLDMMTQIEEFTHEANMERPSQALRVLVEAGLDRYSQGYIDVTHLSAIQSNATAEAIGLMYEVLSEVVERVTRR